jgi:hypothetical protein
MANAGGGGSAPLGHWGYEMSLPNGDGVRGGMGVGGGTVWVGVGVALRVPPETGVGVGGGVWGSWTLTLN